MEGESESDIDIYFTKRCTRLAYRKIDLLVTSPSFRICSVWMSLRICLRQQSRTNHTKVSAAEEIIIKSNQIQEVLNKRKKSRSVATYVSGKLAWRSVYT